jgi:hypothetical protein
MEPSGVSSRLMAMTQEHLNERIKILPMYGTLRQWPMVHSVHIE